MKLIVGSFLLGIISIFLCIPNTFRQLYDFGLQYMGVPEPTVLQLASINLTEAEHNFDKVARELVSAFRTTGFAYLIDNRGFDPDTLLYWTKWFFNLPEHEKKKLIRKAFNPGAVNVYRGYFPLIRGGHSFKEAFEIGTFEREAFNQEIPLASEIRNLTLTPEGQPYMRNIVEEKNVWPTTGDVYRDMKFRETMITYYKFYLHTCEKIFHLLMHGLGYKDVNYGTLLFGPKTLTTFRLIHYPTRLNNPETIPSGAWDGKQAIVTGEHFDSSFLTVLATFDNDGLQIKPKGYTKWIDVPADKNKLVINIGALLSHMSKGELIATNHRVIDTGADRYSAPMFYEPAYDGDVSKTFDGDANEFVGEYKKYGPWMTNRTSMFAEYATTDFGVAD